MRDPLPALGTDAVHRLQFGDPVLDDRQDFGSEPPDQFLRKNRPGDRGWRHCLRGARLELQPVFLVPDPPTLGDQPFPSGHRRQRPDDGRLLPVPRCFHAQNTEATFVVMKG
jgi:hypothetical protein